MIQPESGAWTASRVLSRYARRLPIDPTRQFGLRNHARQLPVEVELHSLTVGNGGRLVSICVAVDPKVRSGKQKRSFVQISGLWARTGGRVRALQLRVRPDATQDPVFKGFFRP